MLFLRVMDTLPHVLFNLLTASYTQLNNAKLILSGGWIQYII